MRLIAIDPGKTSGFAEFHNGKLVEAMALSEREILTKSPVGRGVCVIELPVVYPTRNVPAADLIDLAVLVGDLRGLYRRHAFETVLVKPRTWKGTTPKAIHHKRLLAALASEERDRLPLRPRAKNYDHNMLDAIGIGLWQLTRKGER